MFCFAFSMLRKVALSAALILAIDSAGMAADGTAPHAPRETPLSMVNALHTAFGEHHARAVHTKGVMLEGSFTPAAEGKSLTREPIFAGGTLPVVARF